jgi:hypothetical protein
MSYQSLKGFNNIFEQTLNNELQDNIIEFLDWGLLEKGNYFNVTLGETAPNGSDYSLLSLSNNSNYTSGQAWDSFRKNWVWQSGIGYSPEPLVGTNDSIPGISGVYVDDVFYPSDTTGSYAHKVDYFNGRIIFDSPIPTGSKVQAEYSYKYVNIVYSNSIPWLREIQYNSNEPGSTSNLPSEMIVQLPAIAVEIVPRRTMRGFQLGGGQFVYTDVLFHCLAEDEMTRNKLVDIISLQNDKSIFTFDSNKIADSGAFPLDYNGVPVSGALRYPELVDYYRGERLRFQNSIVQGMELINSNFYAGIVRTTVETIHTSI